MARLRAPSAGCRMLMASVSAAESTRKWSVLPALTMFGFMFQMGTRPLDIPIWHCLQVDNEGRHASFQDYNET